MNYKHGHAVGGVTPTYKTWEDALHRCRHHPEYAGRGITFDPRWADFTAFLSDMGERPDGLTLDRIDNDGHYCKDNCRWATYSEQNSNQRKRRERKTPRKDARFSQEQVASILRDSRVHDVIAEDYGVSRSFISMLKRGERYLHTVPLRPR